jgi:predicted nucleic acid-binding protein
VLVIADSSPIHYLLLIGHIDILTFLYERIIVPDIVISELRHRRTPQIVRDWIEARPAWVGVGQPRLGASGTLTQLDDGERDKAGHDILYTSSDLSRLDFLS